MINNDVLIYSFPLRKKFFVFLCALFIIGLAYEFFISGIYLVIFIGSLFLMLAIFALYRILTISTVLTVTREGIIPHSAMKHGANYVIPWHNIRNIYVAQQRGRNITESYLAIQLFNTELLDKNQTSAQNILDVLEVQMSDKSGGDIYVSVRMLGKSAETIVEEVKLFRSQYGV